MAGYVSWRTLNKSNLAKITAVILLIPFPIGPQCLTKFDHISRRKSGRCRHHDAVVYCGNKPGVRYLNRWHKFKCNSIFLLRGWVYCVLRCHRRNTFWPKSPPMYLFLHTNAGYYYCSKVFGIRPVKFGTICSNRMLGIKYERLSQLQWANILYLNSVENRCIYHLLQMPKIQFELKYAVYFQEISYIRYHCFYGKLCVNRNNKSTLSQTIF